MTTPICKACSQPIHGRYLTALNATWHPEHFCCGVCNKPVEDARFYTHEDQPCHVACYENNIATRCTLCNKPLMGKYRINYWGESYCNEHTNIYPPCSYCGRLVPHISKRTRRRSVDDVRCDICASTAIESAPQAKHLMPQLITWLESIGLRFRKKTFRLEVLDRADFLSRDGRRDPLGLTLTTRYMRNNKLDRVEVSSVAILQGLPHTLFEGVCVHELGHVWLAQHKVVDLPMIEEEGFCELLAHKHYTRIGSKADQYHAERIAKNSSPVYGDGFRMVQRLEARVGFAQIIKSLQRKKLLPL